MFADTIRLSADFFIMSADALILSADSLIAFSHCRRRQNKVFKRKIANFVL